MLQLLMDVRLMKGVLAAGKPAAALTTTGGPGAARAPTSPSPEATQALQVRLLAGTGDGVGAKGGKNGWILALPL